MTSTVAHIGSPIAPYGGRLVDLVAAPEEREAQMRRAAQLPSLRLSERSLCDLELLAVGAFSPLDRFLGEASYRSVLAAMRLASGELFPVPVTLPVGDEEARALRPGGRVALRSPHNDLLAVLTVEELFRWDLAEEAEAVFGTADTRHPVIAEMHGWGGFYVSGPLAVVRLPEHRDFRELRLSPVETRARLTALGRSQVVAFQTRNPLHRAHEELTRRAAEEIAGVLLLHPVVGLTKPGDVDHFTRVRTYKALARHYDPRRIVLALLPLAMRLAGPREALWHALVRRNYGASHLIVGRDHASPGADSLGRPFWAPYAAQELVARHAEELGVGVVPFEELVYLPDEARYEEVSRVPERSAVLRLSGTEVRDQYLGRGRRLPEWFTRPEVAEILAEAYPPRHRQGFCVWLTGLSGAGKSATAEELVLLLEERGRPATLLDGDVVRTHLSKGLGFSREDRDTNVRRIGWVAGEIVRHGGVAVCAAISPYRATRNEVRAMVGSDRFVEVFVDTPLDECERRDAKGLYAAARRGEIEGFTGVDDPYEPPAAPEVRLAAALATPEDNAWTVVDHLVECGFVLADAAVDAPRDVAV